MASLKKKCKARRNNRDEKKLKSRRKKTVNRLKKAEKAGEVIIL